ncbi:hypothetical protein [Alicyclobacillus sp. SO9]|uniref:hypothetical protein n=1 Tax=Alicyclobacillus sp. SO9 TaxID=2665646 RepID=UPI0018E6E4D9|nr:hypothetical protein [Alicyclobacillus sp. SO9]QQE77830.1 hypothetical protein GI364_18185 [Alicyclobacillus sp. SO9]
MAQKYRLIKTDSTGSRYSPSAVDSGAKDNIQPNQTSRIQSGSRPSYQPVKSQRKLRFWRTFTIVLFSAVIVVAALLWMHNVSGSLGHIRHSLVQQSQTNAQQNRQLSQIQSTLQSIQHDLATLGQQMQTDFLKLWTAVSHSK